jgi:hypothetical protein
LLQHKDGPARHSQYWCVDMTPCQSDKNSSPRTAATASTGILSVSSSLAFGSIITSNGKLNRDGLVASGMNEGRGSISRSTLIYFCCVNLGFEAGELRRNPGEVVPYAPHFKLLGA